MENQRCDRCDKVLADGNRSKSGLCLECWRARNRGADAGNYRGGHITTDGYRMQRVNGKYTMEHRLVWEAAYGKLPDEYVVHHINGS